MPKLMKKLAFLGFGLGLAVTTPALVPSALAQPNSMAQIVDARIHQICQSIGIDPAVLAFSYCRIALETSADQSVQAHGTLATSGPIEIKGIPSGPQDYYRSPPEEQNARVQTACRELGVNMETGVYQRCVKSLQAVLWQATLSN